MRTRLLVYMLFVFGCCAAGAQGLPKYKNPALSVDERVADLLGRMTVGEKVGQLTCMPGWEMYEKSGGGVGVSEKFREAVRDRSVGMLWATLRADPWTQKTLETGLDPRLAAEAVNAIQKYVIENTRLGIPVFIAEECPHGHMAIGATVFPTSIGQASTWNPGLAHRMAAAIAAEARAQGAHIGYGPVLDLAREPRWSRVEETYGEDPVLIARMGEAIVRGVQGDDLRSGRNVVSTLKHFAAYGDPAGGHNGGAMSVGERDLRQNYLYPFRAAVCAGALSVMSAYNSIDGIPCTASTFLLSDILRGEWGFDGFTVSDLGSIEGLSGTHGVARSVGEGSVLAITSGLDVDLGGNAYSRSLAGAVADGQLDMATLDRAVARVLRLKFGMGLFENPYVNPAKAADVGNPDNRGLTAEVARQSVILLKNENNILPLSKTTGRIAVIGPNADNMYNQLGDYTAPQKRSEVVTVLDGIRRAVSPVTGVVYVKGCAIRDTVHTQIADAVEAARRADVAVVVVGGSSARDFKTEYRETGAATVKDPAAYEEISDMESGEGFDRSTLALLGKQLDLLKAVHATGTPVVVVYIQGRPLDMNWAAENAAALLCAWYPGQEGGTAVADVLFGNYNPAGRLPVSVPRSVGQLPVYYNHLRPAPHGYVEGASTPLYPFGYGLSYTQFEYADLQVTSRGDEFEVTFIVANTGPSDGDEVVQMYITHPVSPVVTPVKQLMNFRRVHIPAGGRETVTFTVAPEDLMIYDARMERVAVPGTYHFTLGGSSADDKLHGLFTLQ